MFTRGFKLLFSFFKFFSLVLIPLSCFAVIFGCICFCWFIKLHYVDKLQYTRSGVVRIPSRSLFLRLFYDLPRQIVYDKMTRQPGYFMEHGIHMFCGEQGSGKTISAVEMMLRWQKQYPKSKMITNFEVASQNDALTDWRQLLTYNNDIYGVICGIDEIQNWFMSGKNQLPVEMLEVVTQNRKNRRAICCTAQVFTRVNKGLREQVRWVYQPHTFFGCFTVVIKRKPVFDSEGNVLQLKFKNMYCFVHCTELREAFDTYKVIHTLAEEGFKERPLQVVNYVNSDSDSRRKR